MYIVSRTPPGETILYIMITGKMIFTCSSKLLLTGIFEKPNIVRTKPLVGYNIFLKYNVFSKTFLCYSHQQQKYLKSGVLEERIS